MQTVVLAAGEGTRMRPLTATRPKPMLPVLGRPLLAHVLDAAVAAGATDLVIVVGYHGDAIRDHFGDRYEGVPIRYVDQAAQRGTAHALSVATPLLDTAEPFVVLNGDAVYDPDDLAALYRSGPAVGTIEVPNPEAYGVLVVEDDVVVDVIEKPADPPSNSVNAGAYVFPGRAADWLDVDASPRGELELTDVLSRLCAAERVTPVSFGRWLDVGRPWDLLEANEIFLGDVERDVRGDVDDSATLVGPVVVEPGATVRSGVVIEGPVLVRAGASIGPNAYVRGSSVIGTDAHVGHAVEVKNSVLFEGATVGHLSYVGDSLLGRDVNFGAGTTTANLRHDDRPVSVVVNGTKTSTDRRKFGVVCGDGVKTGIHTSLNAGVRIASGRWTGPNETVMEDLL